MTAAELRAAYKALKIASRALEACRDPWYSADDHAGQPCPEPSCPACYRQEEEAREKARAALDVIDRALHPDAYDQAVAR